MTTTPCAPWPPARSGRGYRSHSSRRRGRRWTGRPAHTAFTTASQQPPLTYLDVVSLPGLSPQHHDGDAGSDAQAAWVISQMKTFQWRTWGQLTSWGGTDSRSCPGPRQCCRSDNIHRNRWSSLDMKQWEKWTFYMTSEALHVPISSQQL